MANTLIGRDLAVDLGTASTLVYVRGRGVVVDEPSLVALDDARRAPGGGAAGRPVRRQEPGAPRRPVHDGVVADFDAAEQMLHFATAARGRR